MVSDIEDEIRVEKNHPQLDEASIVLLNSPYSLDETVEKIGSVSVKLDEHCNIHCDECDHVPPKKRNFWNYEICRTPELSTACILCDLADDSVLPCSGDGCPLALHRKCAELDHASSYCPYCLLKYQATRSMAAKPHVPYGCTKLESGDLAAIARENLQPDNGSDQTLPMQLNENLHQIRKVLEQLKALNFQLDESADQFIDMDKSCGEASVVINDHFIAMDKPCGEASVVVNDQPKRVLWTVEEEDLLMVGVKIYSKKIRKNMPWKKILEMGKGVFHINRSSSDLKDKWRKMVHM